VQNVRTFDIDPDIRRARTLPSEFYTRQDHFELSKERIFARTWQFAAGPELGTGLTPITLLPGFFDEPLLIVRDAAASRCISNVCTHRGKLLVEEPCKADLIRCGYHGRRFSLDGKFLSMPEFEGVENFPSSADDLAAVLYAEIGGFHFVSLDPAAPVEEFVGEMPDPESDQPLQLVSARDFQVDAHWALYCENYLEGFHIPYVHRSLNELVDYGSYTTETFRYSSLQTGYDSNGGAAGRYLFVFPNIMFNFYEWGISVNVVLPISPARSVVRYLTYVNDPSSVGTGAGADLDRVELEDQSVVESVQKGIRSRYYSRGRYSPTREQGTHHFHRLIAEFLG
jgi:choline monooxygenase